MKIRYTETALAEIDGICAYVELHDPTAAAGIAAAVERTVARIAMRPESAPIVHEGKVRAKLIERYQYRVFYELAGGEVVIRNVRSTRRQRPWDETGN